MGSVGGHSGRCSASPVCDPPENLKGTDPQDPAHPQPPPGPRGPCRTRVPLVPLLSPCQAGNSWPQQRRQRCLGWEPRQPSASVLLTPRRKSGKFPRTSFISELICSHSIFGTGLVCRDFFVVIVSRRSRLQSKWCPEGGAGGFISQGNASRAHRVYCDKWHNIQRSSAAGFTWELIFIQALPRHR